MATRKKQSKVPETITSAAARLEELRGELLTVGEWLAGPDVGTGRSRPGAVSRAGWRCLWCLRNSGPRRHSK